MVRKGFTHEATVGATVEWFTPPEIFDWIGLRFDLDVASPLAGHVPWIPADRFMTQADDALSQEWVGSVWCNPPFSMIGKFMQKMAEHRNGSAISFARTETRWFQESIGTAEAVLFLTPRVAFIDEQGNRGKSPACGSFLAAWGSRHVEALKRMSGHGLLATFETHPKWMR